MWNGTYSLNPMTLGGEKILQVTDPVSLDEMSITLASPLLLTADPILSVGFLSPAGDNDFTDRTVGSVIPNRRAYCSSLQRSPSSASPAAEPCDSCRRGDRCGISCRSWRTPAKYFGLFTVAPENIDARKGLGEFIAASIDISELWRWLPSYHLAECRAS
jgi:hypothetical protein